MLPDSLLRLQTRLLWALASCMETTEESGGKFKLSHCCRMYTGRAGPPNLAASEEMILLRGLLTPRRASGTTVFPILRRFQPGRAGEHF